MLKTKKKLDDLLERHEDIDIVYVNNTLKEYDDHVQYYSILRTEQQMENSNAKLDEWWELAKAQFRIEMEINWLHT
jgi:hypothetical protein